MPFPLSSIEFLYYFRGCALPHPVPASPALFLLRANRADFRCASRLHLRIMWHSAATGATDRGVSMRCYAHPAGTVSSARSLLREPGGRNSRAFHRRSGSDHQVAWRGVHLQAGNDNGRDPQNSRKTHRRIRSHKRAFLRVAERVLCKMPAGLTFLSVRICDFSIRERHDREFGCAGKCRFPEWRLWACAKRTAKVAHGPPLKLKKPIDVNPATTRNSKLICER
jgi:hypothetical protein